MNRLSTLLVLLGILSVCQCVAIPPPVELETGPLGTLEWEPTLPPRPRSEGPNGAVNESRAAAAPGSSAPRRALAGLGYDGGGVIEEEADDLQQLANVVFETTGTSGSQYYLGTTDESATDRAAIDSTTWRKARAAANAVTLSIGDEDELALLGVEATAWVDGMRARVLMDCLFENDREATLEGTFKLKLPEGATPYYLAFGEEVLADGARWTLASRDDSAELGPEPESILRDREGHWKGARSARFVPRGQAARAYKNTVRRQVDPALMEWAGAGVFQAHVYPLTPHRTHRIVVGYEVDLVRVPGTIGVLELQLNWPTELPALSLDLFVLAPSATKIEVTPAATKTQGSSGRKGFHFPATDTRSFGVRTFDNTGAAIVSQEDTGYFALDLTPELQSSSGSGAATAVFVVDTSLSSAPSFETWLDLMQATLDNNRSTLSSFAVLFFDVSPRWWRASLTPNTSTAVAELRAFASSLALEGASDLGAALAAASHPAWQPGLAGSLWDLFLLSDGAATWGAADAYALSASMEHGFAGPLFAYTTGQSGTDREMLEHLARERGGAVFTVNGPADIAGASVAHHGRPFTIESLELPGCSDLLLRGRPTGIFPGQTLRLVGRGTPRVGDVVELLVDSGLGRGTLRFPITAALATPLATRAYGQVATLQLEAFGRTTREAAEAFATRFRVPGKAASLLMLDSDEAYAAQGILSAEAAKAARDQAAGPLVQAALRDLEGLLDDPVRAFLELLEPLALSQQLPGDPERNRPRLEQLGFTDPRSTPPAALALDPEFVAALASLPKPSFRIDAEPLAFAGLASSAVPAAFAEELASGKPAYAALQAEVARRLAELEPGEAVRALSNLVELNPGNGVFVRDVAQTLSGWGLFGHAYGLYQRVAEARPFEPQSYLALARCAEESGRADLALAWYTIALTGNWAPRFGDFRQVVAFNALHFLRGDAGAELSGAMARWAESQIPSLAALVESPEADLAISIEWNTDGTDIDLHIVDPLDEHCFYGHRDTALGGHLSADVTQGYGPELFVLPNATPGTYTVSAHFFANNSDRTSVRTKILATVWQHWGSSDETVSRRVIQLDTASQEHGIVAIRCRTR